MKYDTNDSLKADRNRIQDYHEKREELLNKTIQKQTVHLRRVIVLLNKKHLTPGERTTLDLAMQVADISQESVNRIIKNELPWPR